MALPNSLDAATPLGSTSPAQGDDQLRGIKQYLVDVFGVPNGSQITAQATAVSTAGVVTISQSGFTVPTLMQGNASSILRISSRYSSLELQLLGVTKVAITDDNHFTLASGVLLYGGTGQTPLMTTSGLLSIGALGLEGDVSGDILYKTGGGSWTRLAAGSSGQFLTTQGNNGDPPVWITGSAGGGVTTSDNPVTWSGQHFWSGGFLFGFTNGASGRLGIGTATPTNTVSLEVKGRAYVGSHMYMAGEVYLVQGGAQGRLGIATTNPTASLDVKGRALVGSHFFMGGDSFLVPNAKLGLSMTAASVPTYTLDLRGNMLVASNLFMNHIAQMLQGTAPSSPPTGYLNVYAASHSLGALTLATKDPAGAIKLVGQAPTMQVYTSAGANTWTKPAGLTKVRIRLWGGGGGGGGSNSAQPADGAEGGGGGGYSEKWITASALGATETATVGSGGAGGSGAASGSAGGTSSFGSHCSATGGSGGEVGTASTDIAPGGAGSNGDINMVGQPGDSDHADSAASARGGIGGMAGGGGGAGGYGNFGAAGTNGNQPGGGGGSGGAPNGTSRAGGSGGDGMIVVEEYY